MSDHAFPPCANLLDKQIDLKTLGAGYVRETHGRFERIQEQIDGGEQPPSEQAIDLHREKFGEEYRLQTEGDHPVSHRRTGSWSHSYSPRRERARAPGPDRPA